MKKTALTFIFIPLLTSAVFAASKESDVKKGNALYRKGAVEAALKNYEDALKTDPESPAIHFDLGTALYKNKQYAEAVSHLQKGLLSDAPILKNRARFNLGDALYKQGMDLEDKQRDQAIGLLEESLRQFSAVMNVDDKDKDAQYNHDIVQKELERLKKKQPEQKKQQNRNKDQEQNNQDQPQGQQDQKQDQARDKSSPQSPSENGEQSKMPDSDNKNGAQKKDEQKPEQGFSQEKDIKDQSGPDKDSNSPQPQPGEMTKAEAKALLKQFEQGNESAGLLNFAQHHVSESPVLKDW